MRIQKDAAFANAQTVFGAQQDVAIFADIFADAFMAPVAVAHEIRADRHERVAAVEDAHIRDQPARARLWKFSVAVRIIEANDALAYAFGIVGNREQ